VRFDEFVAELEFGDEFLDHVAVVRGKTGGESSDGEGAIAESFLRGPGEIGGIGPAGKRDEKGIEFRKIC